MWFNTRSDTCGACRVRPCPWRRSAGDRACDDGAEISRRGHRQRRSNRDYGGLKQAIICLSGSWTEARYTNTNLRQLLTTNVARVDVEMAEDALRHATGSPPLDVAIRAARRVVELEWNRIDRVAVQLRRRFELDFEECRRIALARR
jgi:hypothetical protein